MNSVSKVSRKTVQTHPLVPISSVNDPTKISKHYYIVMDQGVRCYYFFKYIKA